MTVLFVRPRADDLMGQPILRALPAAACRSVGPFVFFDHMLPHLYQPGSGVNIEQHPHIGLSTLTYLFEGTLQHKDSLGSDQQVQPGEVSWMTAGRGIAHVERTPQALWPERKHLHGLQVWLALPAEKEQCSPSYHHYNAEELPENETLGVTIRMIAGNGFNLQSPVAVHSPCIYADIQMQAGTTLSIAQDHEERALYLIEGEARLDDEQLPFNQLAVLSREDEPTVLACTDCRLVIIGGQPLGARRINWNFVASDPALIEQARQRWRDHDWPEVPGETTRIELPR